MKVGGGRLGFLGQFGVHHLALGVREERRAAVVAVLGLEGAGQPLHLGDAALRELRERGRRGARARARRPRGRRAATPRRARRGLSPPSVKPTRYSSTRSSPKLGDDGAQLRRARRLQRVLEHRRRPRGCRRDARGGRPRGSSRSRRRAAGSRRRSRAAASPRGTRLRDPLLEARGAPGVAARVLLPAEDGLAARRRDRGDHEARVGEQLRGLGHAREVDARDLAGDGGIARASR